jgi:hypothetical protein
VGEREHEGAGRNCRPGIGEQGAVPLEEDGALDHALVQDREDRIQDHYAHPKIWCAVGEAKQAMGRQQHDEALDRR